jgi:hypothetical protein
MNERAKTAVALRGVQTMNCEGASQKSATVSFRPGPWAQWDRPQAEDYAGRQPPRMNPGSFTQNRMNPVVKAQAEPAKRLALHQEIKKRY